VMFSLSVMAGDDMVTASTEQIKPSNTARFAQVRWRATHPFAFVASLSMSRSGAGSWSGANCGPYALAVFQRWTDLRP